MLPFDEFGLIETLFAPLSAGFPGAGGLKDDAATFSCPEGFEVVASADMLVGDSHFLMTDPACEIAKKALRTNLSDLAAKGARPFGFLLSLCLPKNLDAEWLRLFAQGLKEDIEEFEIPLIGGDTTSTSGPLVLSITAFGQVAAGKAPRRWDGKIGDIVWVSGTIGDGALGLVAELGRGRGLDEIHAAYLLGRYRLPRPRLALGSELIGLVHAAMDVSDGLVGDLGHICRASGVGAVIDARRVPLSVAARAAIAAGWGDGLVTALTGGDDYELLFTAPPEATAALLALPRRVGVTLSAIGRLVPGSAVELLYDGRAWDVGRGGYRHF